MTTRSFPTQLVVCLGTLVSRVMPTVGGMPNFSTSSSLCEFERINHLFGWEVEQFPRETVIQPRIFQHSTAPTTRQPNLSPSLTEKK